MSAWVDGTVVSLRQWTDRLYSLQMQRSGAEGAVMS